MADPTVTITQIDRISAADFNQGFADLYERIDSERQYYDKSGASLAKTKNKLYNLFNDCAINGVIYKVLYKGNLAAIVGGIIDGDYLEQKVGLIFYINGSRAHMWEEEYLGDSDLAVKNFLPTINCVGTKEASNTNRRVYDQKVFLAAQSWSHHTLTTEVLDDNGACMLYQRYITT